MEVWRLLRPLATTETSAGGGDVAGGLGWASQRRRCRQLRPMRAADRKASQRADAEASRLRYGASAHRRPLDLPADIDLRADLYLPRHRARHLDLHR